MRAIQAAELVNAQIQNVKTNDIIEEKVKNETLTPEGMSAQLQKEKEM